MRPPPPTCDVEVVWPFFSSSCRSTAGWPHVVGFWLLVGPGPRHVNGQCHGTDPLLLLCPARARGTLRSGRRQVHRRERERERGGRALRCARVDSGRSAPASRAALNVSRTLASCTNTMHRSLLARASGHEADVEAQARVDRRARGGRNATGRAGESVTRQPDSTAGVETDRGARSHSQQVRECRLAGTEICSLRWCSHSALHCRWMEQAFFLLEPHRAWVFIFSPRRPVVAVARATVVFLSVFISTTITSSVLSQLQQLPIASRFKHHAKDAPHGRAAIIYDWWVARPIGAHGRGVMGLARYFHPGSESRLAVRPCYVAGRGWTLEEHGVLFVRRPLTVPRLCCDVRSGAYHSIYIASTRWGRRWDQIERPTELSVLRPRPSCCYLFPPRLRRHCYCAQRSLSGLGGCTVHWCCPPVCYSDNTHCDSYLS